MAHAVSITYARFDHISPTAVAMATLLHAAVAVALWWVSPLRPIEPYEDAIAITMERENPPTEVPTEEVPSPVPTPDPPVQAASPPAPSPAPPLRWGLAPAEPKADPQEAVGVQQPGPARPETPAEEATQLESPNPDAAKEEEERQLALAVPPPPPPPPPPQMLEKALPPLEPPPPPVTSREVPPPPPPVAKPRLPPPPQPSPRTRPSSPPPVTQQGLQSSPLSHLPQPRAQAGQQASRQAPTFQNPADLFGERRASDEYIWYVARKISQHQAFVGNATTESGTVQLRVTIARDGRLVGVGVSRSSGLSSLDNTSLNIVRQAAPYPPLPPEITGAQHTFTLPLYYRRNQ